MMRARVRSWPCGDLTPMSGCPGGGKRFAAGAAPGLPAFGVGGRPLNMGEGAGEPPLNPLPWLEFLSSFRRQVCPWRL